MTESRTKKPEPMPHLIPVVYGDWSGDGGGGTWRVYFWSNKPLAAWRKAFEKGCSIVGVDLAEDVGADPERAMDESDLEKLRAAGFDYEMQAKPDANGRLEVYCDEFEAMTMFVIGKGDPKIKHAAINTSDEDDGELHPGGYGLG